MEHYQELRRNIEEAQTKHIWEWDCGQFASLGFALVGLYRLCLEAKQPEIKLVKLTKEDYERLNMPC